MKVLLINGGPHKDGATNRALTEVASTLKAECVDADIVWLGNEPLAGCIGCGACKKNGRCFREDKVNEVAAVLDSYDGYVFGSPVHYAAASGAISSFMDRLFMSAGSKMYMKPAAAVVSCRRGGASAAFDELNKYFTINCMPVVSSQYWNQVHGANAEQVEHDGEGLQTMRTLARNMAFILKAFDCAKQSGIEIPTKEPQIRTSYIR